MEPANIPITIKGRYFYRSSQRFFVKGIVYQVPAGLSPKDPICDERVDLVRSDIELLKELGVNTIHVYSVDHTAAHDDVMRLLADAGIYVLLGLSTPKQSVSRQTPAQSYRVSLLEHFFSTAAAFSQYPNVLGFVAANSVVSNSVNSRAAEYVRAVVRDVKRYMKLKNEIAGERIVPVGVIDSNLRSLQQPLLEFSTAGSRDERVDFYGINNYQWVGTSDLKHSGWANMLEMSSECFLPQLVAEYGSVVQGPRIFEETTALYDPKMTEVFSGGCMYEFNTGSNKHGIVRGRDHAERRTIEFANFKQRLKDARPEETATVESQDYAENWIGSFAETGEMWITPSRITASLIDWDTMVERIKDNEYFIV